MGINGHTRLDLYSSCTAVQVTLKILHSYYSYFPLQKLKFQLTYFPGLYSSAVWTKRHLSRWESMDIPDLTCTVPVRPDSSLWKFSIAIIGFPLKKLKFQITYFPGLYSSAVWTKRHLSIWESMDIPELTCTVPVQPYRSLWKFYIAIIAISHTKTQISVNILPRTVQLCRLDQKTPFKMGINGHTRLDLYSSCTARTGHFENST